MGNRTISFFVSRVFLLTVFFTMFSGCFWIPGDPFYTVKISGLDSAHLTQADIDSLNRFTNTAISNEDFAFFNKYEDPVQQGQLCTTYSRAGKHKNLDLTYCSGEKGFEIELGDSPYDDSPELRNEIDRLGKVFYKELAVRFGEKNIRIEHQIGHAPFGGP